MNAINCPPGTDVCLIFADDFSELDLLIGRANRLPGLRETTFQRVDSFKAEQGWIAVVERNEEDVGFVTWWPLGNEIGVIDSCELAQLFITPSARRQGVAQRVVCAFMRWAASQEVIEVMVEAAPTDLAYLFWLRFLENWESTRIEHSNKWVIPTAQFKS